MDLLNRLIARWNAKHLVAAWSVYWLGLVAWAAASVAPGIWHLSRPDVKGTASVGFDGGIVSVTMLEAGKNFFRGGISIQTLAFLIAVPPLLLWAWWLAAQKRPPAVAPEQVDAGSAPRDLANRRDEGVELRRPDK